MKRRMEIVTKVQQMAVVSMRRLIFGCGGGVGGETDAFKWRLSEKCANRNKRRRSSAFAVKDTLDC